MSNAERQRRFRARHPNYHKRYKRWWQHGAAGAAVVPAVAEASPAPVLALPGPDVEGQLLMVELEALRRERERVAVAA